MKKKNIYGLEILKDYKSGYTLSMIRDKYEISTALALDIIHKFTIAIPNQLSEARLVLESHSRMQEINKCIPILRDIEA